MTDSIPFLLPYYEITKWTRHLRAKYTFEHVDPLADIPERELKAGNLPIWQVGVRYSEGGDVGAFYMYL